MATYSLSTLFILLGVLVLVSAFFSGSEIGMMSLNRYKLRHHARAKDKRALRVERLLADTDKLLGVILIGNTLANIVASAIATLIGQRLYGDTGVAIATGLLTFVVLIIAEMTPKALAARYPQPVAYYASALLSTLLKVCSPVVWLTNHFSRGLLFLLGVRHALKSSESLTHEELVTVVNESGSLISPRNKRMLLSILDLEAVSVEDIMVPRNEIIGIDLNQNWDDILEQLETAQHTRIPIYQESINEITGLIHVRTILNLIMESRFDKSHLETLAEKPYFILEGVSLYQQLYDFQNKKRRIGFVVDEYGEILGLVTLEDILEEIVGEFTTDIASLSKSIKRQEDGSHLVDGGIALRDLNRSLSWSLPETGVKTLNGLITETLGDIPPAHCCLELAGRRLEILLVNENKVKVVRVLSAARSKK